METQTQDFQGKACFPFKGRLASLSKALCLPFRIRVENRKIGKFSKKLLHTHSILPEIIVLCVAVCVCMCVCVLVKLKMKMRWQ